MSFDLAPTIEFIGMIAPTTFVVAIVAGIIGNLLFGWFAHRFMQRGEPEIASIEELIEKLREERSELSEHDELFPSFYLKEKSFSMRLQFWLSLAVSLASVMVMVIAEYLINVTPSISRSKEVEK